MASSQRIETTTAQAASELGFVPHCPVCGGAMVVRAQRHGDEVTGLYWGCRKPLVCSGTRRIRDPLVIQPMADASSMAIFEWERSRDRRGWIDGEEAAPARGGLFGRLGRAISRPAPPPARHADFAVPTGTGTGEGALDGLIDYGFIVLDGRSVASARAVMDHLVVGPSGMFVVDGKSWPGQISCSADAVYIDGRQRTGATDNVLRATAAVEQVLGHELKGLGTTVHPVITIDLATNRNFEGNVGKVALATSRSVQKVIRAGAPTLGPETVVRLALAADRLLD
jgi:hypothetical protein